MIYVEGQTVWPQVTFRDLDGALIDPVGGVTIEVEDPLGNITSPAPMNISVGVYRAQVDLTVEGWWSYRWEGVGAFGTAVCEGRICVKASSLVGS
jgi:hypothetical protein